MKHFHVSTPKNIPASSSPLFPIQQHYSPFISPYMYPLQLVNSPAEGCQRRDQQDQEFVNFNLQKENQEINQQNIAKCEDNRQNDSSDSQRQEGQEKIYTSKVHKIIEILVRHVEKSEQKLAEERKKYISEDQQDLRQVYDILIKKFKKLKKTKQEMTKYCMRKAFKFLSQKIRKQNTHLKDCDSGLKYYFSSYENDQTFTIPFKKNSLQKTMNSSFLKKVFSSQLFLTDYMEFLKYFRKLIEEDNTKKIKYLAEIIQTHLAHRSIKKLQNIKRLPWTQTILDRTQDLAEKLTHHSPFPNAIISQQLSGMITTPRQEPVSYIIKEQKSQTIANNHYNHNQNNGNNLKRNIILLTPLMQPLSPPHIKQEDYSLSSGIPIKRSKIKLSKDSYDDEQQA